MKKVFYFMAIAAAAMFALSCNKDDGGKNGEEEDNYTGPIYRVKTMNNWTFTYGADGRVTKAVEAGSYKNDQQEDVAYEDEFIFDYTANPVTVKKDGSVKFEITFGANGYATTIDDKSENRVITLTYDKDGFLSTAKVNGEDMTEVSAQNGCLQYWTRWNSGKTAWRYKMHTYYTDRRNIGNVHTSYAEDAKVKRWMHECGLVGKADRYVVATAQWSDSDKKAVYDTNEYDENGCLKKESKVYNNGDPEVYNFTFELVSPGTDPKK